jgi:hypothetical protein
LRKLAILALLGTAFAQAPDAPSHSRQAFWLTTALHAASVVADVETTAHASRQPFLLNGQWTECHETGILGGSDGRIPSRGAMYALGAAEVGGLAFLSKFIMGAEEHRCGSDVNCRPSKWRYLALLPQAVFTGLHARAAINNQVCLR